jgi:hypothetical protein
MKTNQHQTDTNLVATISCAENYRRMLLVGLPFLFIFLIGYIFVKPALISYIKYTAFVISISLLAAYIFAFNRFLVVKVYEDSIEFYYPFKWIKKSKRFKFFIIKKIKFNRANRIKNNRIMVNQIEVTSITSSKKYFFINILDDKQYRELSKALDSVATFKVLNKVQYD